ncbi:MAG TPA: hypothetical protein VF590_22740, partial [Isosphaeraceae bacterium]
DLLRATVVTAGPDDPTPIGIAAGAGRVGSAEERNLEACRWLVVRGEAREGRNASRSGMFVALAEEA